MMRSIGWLGSVLIWGCIISARAADDASYWVEPMKKAHARFTGTRGTFAQFGDSITVSMAFWAPLEENPKSMNPRMARAHKLVHEYMKPQCWREWKGAQFGNEGSMTIRWAHDNIDPWLKKLNPESAVIMFGSNDVGVMEAEEYELKLRQVVDRCLANGTIVLVTTMPTRSGQLEKARQFVQAAHRVAEKEKVPVIDYFEEILKRRPDDWDGSLAQFKNAPGDEYQVPTLIARDGVHPSNPKQYSNVYSDAALRVNGFSLRNYLTVLAYGQVIEKVLR